MSINTLLGSPQTLICQCCGMPLEDAIMSHEPDGTLNEAYCKWCYHDGKFAYTDMVTLMDCCIQQMAGEHWPAEQVRAHLEALLPTLDYWKNLH